MPRREVVSYFVAMALGLVALLRYFLFGGEVSSRVWIWVRLVAYAAFLFGFLGLFGQLRLRLLLVYCLPVTAISLLLGLAEAPTIGRGLLTAAEPVVCVWAGAGLSWLLFRRFRHGG